jgi:hypothetical protein
VLRDPLERTDLPGWPVTYASTSWTESSPVIADIDNNGVLDVVLGNENKYITGGMPPAYRWPVSRSR